MKEEQKNQDKKKAAGVLILDDEVFDDDEEETAGNIYILFNTPLLIPLNYLNHCAVLTDISSFLP